MEHQVSAYAEFEKMVGPLGYQMPLIGFFHMTAASAISLLFHFLRTAIGG